MSEVYPIRYYPVYNSNVIRYYKNSKSYPGNNFTNLILAIPPWAIIQFSINNPKTIHNSPIRPQRNTSWVIPNSFLSYVKLH